MNNPSPNSLPNTERFFCFEDPKGDFPFYSGQPASVSNGQWFFVIAMVVVGFLVLALPINWPGGTLGQFLPAVLMPAIPLAALAYVAPCSWTSIFGRVGAREIRLMVGFALLNIIVSMSVGAIVHASFNVTANGTVGQLGALDTTDQVVFFAKTIPQLFGEEVITILPFLALLQLFSRGLGLGRKGAVLAAWLITAVVFGLLHLPTYNWNVLQCIVVIGSARLVLTLPWIMTKNIWVSTGAHIVNDWLLFLMTLLGSSLVAKV
jgi:membrane protease YdiL (CAAX protease family)